MVVEGIIGWSVITLFGNVLDSKTCIEGFLLQETVSSTRIKIIQMSQQQ